MTIKTPVKALRAWEPYVTPDADELAEYMARPFTHIVDADGETVFNAHDLFEFKPGHAERIVACLDACAGIANFPEQGLKAQLLESALAWQAAIAQRDRLANVLEDLLEACDVAPDANCSCHLNPPCNDCVEYGHLREVRATAKALIAKARP